MQGSTQLPPIDPAAGAKLLELYQAGKLGEEDMALVEKGIQSGRLKAPAAPAIPANAPPAKDPLGGTMGEGLGDKPYPLAVPTVETGRALASTAGSIGGAALGGAAGAAAGPGGVLAGGLVGEGLGGALGSMTFDTVYELLHYIGAMGNNAPRPLTSTEIIHEGAKAGVINMALSGGLGVLAKGAGTVIRSGTKAITGLTPAARQAGKDAAAQGMDLSVSDVSEGAVPGLYRNVLGRFPFLSIPFKQTKTAQIGQFQTAYKNIMGEIGIDQTIPQAGRDINLAGQKAFRSFRTQMNRQYEDALKLADKRGPIIPTEDITRTAQQFADQVAKDSPNLRGVPNYKTNTMSDDPGTVWGGPNSTSSAPPSGPIDTPTGVYSQSTAKSAPYDPMNPGAVDETVRMPDKLGMGGKDLALGYLNALTRLPSRITVGQADKMLGEVSSLIDGAARGGPGNVAQLTQLKDLIRKSVGKADDPLVASMFNNADRDYNFLKSVFEAPAGKVFGRVDRNAFKVGMEKLGVTNPDELLPIFRDKNSPQFVEQARALFAAGGDQAGADKIIGNIGFARIKKTFTEATSTDGVKTTIDMDAVKNSLGFGDKKSAEYGVTQAFLRNTGVTSEQLGNFLDAAAYVFRNPVPNSSMFQARRAVMGGLKTVETSVGTGAIVLAATGHPISATGAAASALLLFGGSRFFASPKMLSMLTRFMDPNISSNARTALFTRLSQFAMEKGTAPDQSIPQAAQ